jgi:hypothetical protein
MGPSCGDFGGYATEKRLRESDSTDPVGIDQAETGVRFSQRALSSPRKAHGSPRASNREDDCHLLCRRLGRRAHDGRNLSGVTAERRRMPVSSYPSSDSSLTTPLDSRTYGVYLADMNVLKTPGPLGIANVYEPPHE